MTRKVHKLNYTTTELDRILDKSEYKPFVIWYDEKQGLYRFFPDEEKRDIWIETYLSMEDGEIMPPEIAAYEFIEGGIIAPAPYTINIIVTSDNTYVLEGERGTTLDFTVETVDGNGNPLQENIEVYYTFRSSSAARSISASYSYVPGEGIVVSMNVDKFLSLGKNNITIVVKGKSSGATKTYVATYNVVKFNLSSSFNIALARTPDIPFEVTYTIEGEGDKIVNFYIDGVQAGTPDRIPISEGTAPIIKRHSVDVYKPGKHSLQIVGEMNVGTRTFKSKLLYYEFVVTGIELTTVVISAIFDAGTDIISKIITPYLQAEQYVVKVIDWAYYSSNPYIHNGTVKWSLYNEQGGEIPLSTRTAEVVQAESGTPPEPLRFMPTIYGHYYLQAYIFINNHYELMDEASYEINIIQNSNGVSEATNGITMKLSGLGRDNDEPEETLNSWESTIIRDSNTLHYSTTFYNQPWNANSGWIDGALVLNNGATAVINNKPFGADIFPTANNGCCFEIDFETFNVTDPDGVVLRIGGLGSAQLVITADKAMIKSTNGSCELITRFKSDERVKLAFVVYPQDKTNYYAKVFVYSNGVMSGVRKYTAYSDGFNIGNNSISDSPIGMINIGNAVVEDALHNQFSVCGEVSNDVTVVGCDAGIKIYYIRTYDNYINMYEELSNYIIDSGEDIAYFMKDNDIYNDYKEIDVNKLESTITTVKFTGDIASLIGSSPKDRKISCALEIVSPTNPDIYLTCDFAQVNKAGQSTLEKPVPSFHVRLDKISGNVCYDKDGNMWPKNRWAFRTGNTPEKKFRLQANYMDSSCCHNAAFFRMINEVYPKVTINGQKVLRMPARAYVEDEYPQAMSSHGDDPSGNNWKFPYNLNFAPDSIPCVVVFRETPNDDYRFLGQYVIMEEKKANYANGMHSIYNGIDTKGFADPFGFKNNKSGIKLWDNEGCHQVEVLRASDISYMTDYSQWNTVVNPDTGMTGKEYAFELVYPDDDDLIDKAREEGKPDNYYINLEWDKFYNDVVKPVTDTYDLTNPEQASAAFNELFYGSNPKLDRWGFAAYYCLVLRHACSDSLARNMEFVTYDGYKWTPKWWDADMQCGLEQSGYCNVQPASDRDTKLSADLYALSGRVVQDGVTKSSWLWDGLTGNTEAGIPANEQFMEDVAIMDAALYEAGWRYSNVTKIQDEEYIDTWSKALYNESGIVKYINYGNDEEVNYLSLQGERTQHRHWFLRTSYDYFDALNVCGEYTTLVLRAKLIGISQDNPKKIWITAASTSYFGWRVTNDIGESGVKIEKGETKYLNLDKYIDGVEFTAIMGANKIGKIDFSDVFLNINSQIDFSRHADEVLGSSIREIILGASIARLNEGDFNTNVGATSIGGMTTLTKLDHLNINGMYGLVNVDLSALSNLNRYNAAGTRIIDFKPAGGCNFSGATAELDLPTTVTMIEMNRCSITKNNACVINWYETILEDNVPVEVQLTTVPSTLKAIKFVSMGSDIGVKSLILDWVNAINDDPNATFNGTQLECSDVYWTNVDADDLLLIGEVNDHSKFGGYVKCTSLDSQQIISLQEVFGDAIFSNLPGAKLTIDAESGFVIGAPSDINAGDEFTLTGLSFPLSETISTQVQYVLGYIDSLDQFQQYPVLTENGRRYYRLVDTLNGETAILAKLYEDTGEFITYENPYSNDEYTVAFKAIKGQSTSQITETTIHKRSYPSSIDFNVDYTQGKVVVHDETNNAYYVSSDDVTVVVNVVEIPSENTGTIISDTWQVSSNIINEYGTGTETSNSYTFHVNVAGDELLTGTISHTRTYSAGYSVTKTSTFRFKSPTYEVTQNINAPLQASLYNNSFAQSEYYSLDTEVWQVTNLYTDLDILDSGSLLAHFGEFNSFINLQMTTLDLSNCTLLGSISYTSLEDGTSDYVNVFPRASQTLAWNFTQIDLSNTRLAGINVIQNNNVLTTISYSNYTENVMLQGQTALTTLNIPIACSSTIQSITIDGCSSLTGITWTN